MSLGMQYSKSGLDLTAGFEGFKSIAYQDQGGIWTIGYGHTVNVKQGDYCTEDQALRWLQDDTKSASDCVNHLVDVPLTQSEFDALVDFVFNVGCGNFLRSTLLHILNSGNFEAAAQQFDLWSFDKGKKVAGLLRRREAEAKEFQQEQV